MTVYSQIALNNLIQIDEIQSTATLDFFFRLYWNDTRLRMPALWYNLPLAAAQAGIDLSQVLGVSDVKLNTAPGIWFPDIYFPDAIDQNVGDFLVRLHPGGFIEWSRHVTATFDEASFQYEKYPNDEQVIIMRYSSYGLNSSYLLQKFYKNQPVVLFKNFENEYGFTMNPIWSYVSATGKISLEANGANRFRSTGVILVTVSRQPSGLVMRLGLPILLLVLLAAFIFWAEPETRPDSSVTLLLAVSALYIVVFQNIPMLGYLTTFDNFVLYMFAVIFACTAAHAFVDRVMRQGESWPLRHVIVRAIEALGRVFIVPISLALYFLLFDNVYTPFVIYSAVVSSVLWFIFVGFREFHGLRAAYRKSLTNILEKVDNMNDISLTETIIFNLYFYRAFKTSLNYHYRQHEREKKILAMSNNPMGGQNQFEMRNKILQRRSSGLEAIGGIDFRFTEEVLKDAEGDQSVRRDPSASPTVQQL